MAHCGDKPFLCPKEKLQKSDYYDTKSMYLTKLKDECSLCKVVDRAVDYETMLQTDFLY